MNASSSIFFSANTRQRFTNSGLLADLSWIFTALLQSWLSKWTVLNIMSLKAWHMTQNVPHFCRLWVWRFYDFPTGILTGIFVVCAKKLTLPFKIGCKTLSVTCGDSSPKGRAKASCNRMNGHEKWSASVSMRSINCYTDTRLNLPGPVCQKSQICVCKKNTGR